MVRIEKVHLEALVVYSFVKSHARSVAFDGSDFVCGV